MSHVSTLASAVACAILHGTVPVGPSLQSGKTRLTAGSAMQEPTFSEFKCGARLLMAAAVVIIHSLASTLAFKALSITSSLHTDPYSKSITSPVMSIH